MKLAPLTKLIAAFILTLWALPLGSEIKFLAGLLAFQLVYTASLGVFRKTLFGLMSLAIGAAVLVAIQLALKSTLSVALISGMKMIVMAYPFMTLVASSSVQDLSAALVRQCRVSPEYAFLLTAALRFIPDFLAEGQAIRQAQACRGFEPKKNPIAWTRALLAVVEPLVLGAVARAETLAVSLEMRGFGEGKGPVGRKLSLHFADFIFLILLVLVTIVLLKPYFM